MILAEPPSMLVMRTVTLTLSALSGLGIILGSADGGIDFCLRLADFAGEF